MTSYVISSQDTHGKASDYHIESYIIHVRTMKCLHCSRVHTTSQCFEVHVNPYLTGRTAAHRLVPAKALRGGFSIGHSILKTEETPVCHECFATLDSTTLPKPEFLPLDPAEWARCLQRKYAAAPSVPKAPAQRARIPSLDDL